MSTRTSRDRAESRRPPVARALRHRRRAHGGRARSRGDRRACRAAARLAARLHLRPRRRRERAAHRAARARGTRHRAVRAPRRGCGARGGARRIAAHEPDRERSARDHAVRRQRRCDRVRLVHACPRGPSISSPVRISCCSRATAGSGRARLAFEGRSASGPVHWETTVDFPDHDRDNAFVPRLWATRRIGWLSAARRQNGASPEVDDELRTLGERYGIPTELTSYLVQEQQCRR